MLISLSDGGTPTAIDYPEGGKHDPLLAYIAVRHAGYWAEGFLTLASAPNQTLTRTQAALKAMLGGHQGGRQRRRVCAMRRRARSAGLAVHPAARKVAVGIGLMLEESRSRAGRRFEARGGPGLFAARRRAKHRRSDNAAARR